MQHLAQLRAALVPWKERVCTSWQACRLLAELARLLLRLVGSRRRVSKRLYSTD
jgi:hypothetical protein